MGRHRDLARAGRRGGCVTFRQCRGPGNRLLDLACNGLLPRYWGLGLAAEASRAALAYLWNSTSYDRVYARPDPPNGKSVEAMRRLGMRHHASTAAMITYVLERPAR
ncbi:MAG: GNAT family N-acetyltransferase [Acidobacteriia bacterium]|nr:GNAT family N-acetyltransferase [Terriglobia bacterium]